MVAKQVLYEGRVQGVGFRFSVKSITTGYDVVGMREEPDRRAG